MALDYTLPVPEVIEKELALVREERSLQIKQIKALYAVEIRRLNALLRLTKNCREGASSNGDPPPEDSK